jgi:hypothetical protein
MSIGCWCAKKNDNGAFLSSNQTGAEILTIDLLRLQRTNDSSHPIRGAPRVVYIQIQQSSFAARISQVSNALTTGSWNQVKYVKIFSLASFPSVSLIFQVPDTSLLHILESFRLLA